MAWELRQTAAFEAWLTGLRDDATRAVIMRRIDWVAQGHFGAVTPVGDGVNELLIHAGRGYRVYFVRRGTALIMLHSGEDELSRAQEIASAKSLAHEV